MFLALATPTSGLAWSSKGTSSTLKPAFSMGPLSCSMANWVPSLIPSPTAAWSPDRGLCVAILMVPFASPPSAIVGTISAKRARAIPTYRRLITRLMAYSLPERRSPGASLRVVSTMQTTRRHSSRVPRSSQQNPTCKVDDGSYAECLVLSSKPHRCFTASCGPRRQQSSHQPPTAAARRCLSGAPWPPPPAAETRRRRRRCPPP